MVPSKLWVRAVKRWIPVCLWFLNAIDRSLRISLHASKRGKRCRKLGGWRRIVLPVLVGFLVLIMLRGVLGFYDALALLLAIPRDDSISRELTSHL